MALEEGRKGDGGEGEEQKSGRLGNLDGNIVCRVFQPMREDGTDTVRVVGYCGL